MVLLTKKEIIKKNKHIDFRKFFFLKYFNVVEVINSKLQIFHDKNLSSKHLLDLNLKNNAVFILLSEESIKDNLITVNLDYSSNFLISKQITLRLIF